MSALGAASANAQSLKFTGTQLNPVDSGTINVNGNSSTVEMGALVFSTGTKSIVTYCADATSPLNNSNNPYSVSGVNMNDGSGLALAAKILATNFDVATNKDQQAALQVAIWDALYDNGSSFNYSSGKFKVTNGLSSSVLSLASTYYTNGKNSNPTTAVELFTSQGAGGQSQLHVVPEPASLAVLGLGVFGLVRRRKSSSR